MLLLSGTLDDDGVRVVGPPWRRDFLTAMGLTLADTDDAHSPRQNGRRAR